MPQWEAQLLNAGGFQFTLRLNSEDDDRGGDVWRLLKASTRIDLIRDILDEVAAKVRPAVKVRPSPAKASPPAQAPPSRAAAATAPPPQERPEPEAAEPAKKPADRLLGLRPLPRPQVAPIDEGALAIFEDQLPHTQETRAVLSDIGPDPPGSSGCFQM